MPKTTNPQKTELHLHRLAPLAATRERDEWTASTLKETCFVWAMSAQEARAMVEVATRIAQSEAKTQLPFFSPWSSSAFTSCEEVSPEGDAGRYPAGMVFTQSGTFKEATQSSRQAGI